MLCPHCNIDIPDRDIAHHLSRKGGSSRSEAKRLASAKNGKLGGRKRLNYVCTCGFDATARYRADPTMTIADIWSRHRQYCGEPNYVEPQEPN